MALHVPVASTRRTGMTRNAGAGAAWLAYSCSQASWAGAMGTTMTTMTRRITRRAAVSCRASGNPMTRH